MTDDVDEVRAALSYFFEFAVDDRLLNQVLAEHPDLASTADEWGWADTEVRGQLAGLISVTLIGRRWPTYGDGANIDEVHREVQVAHQRWVTEHDRK